MGMEELKPIGQTGDAGRLVRRASDDSGDDSDEQSAPIPGNLDQINTDLGQSEWTARDLRNIGSSLTLGAGVENNSYHNIEEDITTRSTIYNTSLTYEYVSRGFQLMLKVGYGIPQGLETAMRGSELVDTSRLRDLHNKLKPYLTEEESQAMMDDIARMEGNAPSGDLTLLKVNGIVSTEAYFGRTDSIGNWHLSYGIPFYSRHYLSTVNTYGIDSESGVVSNDSHDATYNAFVPGLRFRAGYSFPISQSWRMQPFLEANGSIALRSGEGPGQVEEQGLENQIRQLRSSIGGYDEWINSNEAALVEMTATDDDTIAAKERLQNINKVLEGEQDGIRNEISELENKLDKVKEGNKKTLTAAKVNIGLEFSGAPSSAGNGWMWKPTFGIGGLFSRDEISPSSAGFWPVADFDESQSIAYGGNAFLDFRFARGNDLALRTRFYAEPTFTTDGDPRIYLQGQFNVDYRNWMFGVNAGWYRDLYSGQIVNDNFSGGASVGFRWGR